MQDFCVTQAITKDDTNENLFDFFEILLLTRATEDLEAEKTANEEAKVRYLREKLPPLQLRGLNIDDLQKVCKEIHEKIHVVDEDRYDCEAKVLKNYRDINKLKLKVQDLGGKFKKPALRKVRVSADEMLKALFGSKTKGSMDLRANLKSVKKEDIKQEKHVFYPVFLLSPQPVAADGRPSLSLVPSC
ncbi:troponin I, skeletal, slow c [Maylandia zebra]|uniref:troponin I, skeletal, slow c n=1 Tax=Maylandia zebra TaxID=106582 RepID=UPI00403CF899